MTSNSQNNLNSLDINQIRKIQNSTVKYRNSDLQKKKLLIFLDGSIGYGGTFIAMYKLLPNLVKEYEVDIVQTLNKNSKYLIPNGFNESLSAIGVAVCTVYRDKAYEQFQNLKKICEQNKYDIIHINFSSSTQAIIAGAAACCAGIKKRILHAHTNGTYNEFINAVQTTILGLIGTKLLACSVSAGEVKFGKKRFDTKGIVLKNAIEVAKYKCDPNAKVNFCKEHDFPLNTLILGTVGRLSIEKNQSVLIRIASNLVSHGHNVVLLLIGDGPYKDSLVEIANQSGIGKVVFFMGNQDNIPYWLSVFDVFLFPSLYEGFGIAALEAQASGLPVICSSGVSQEIAVTPYVHFIKDNSNINEWTEAILSKQYQQRYDSSDLIIQSGYDAESNGRKLIHVYEEG